MLLDKFCEAIFIHSSVGKY